MAILDRLVALLVAIYVVVAFGAATLADRQAGHLIMGAFALIPSVLLLFPTVGTMLAVTLMSLPCCVGATWYADGMQVPALTDKFLWDYSPFMLAVGLYSFFRTLQLVVAARKKAGQA